jgi:hypothetical protein
MKRFPFPWTVEQISGGSKDAFNRPKEAMRHRFRSPRVRYRFQMGKHQVIQQWRHTMNIQRSMLACAATLTLSMSAAYAGPCSPEVTQIQDLIDARVHAKAGAATAPESTAAKLHHQPTPSSIAAAEAEHGQISPEEFNAMNAAMARAHEADAAGDRSACEKALADVKRLLGSAGTQTEHQ